MSTGSPWGYIFRTMLERETETNIQYILAGETSISIKKSLKV